MANQADIIERAIFHEINRGTQRSVGALYGFVVLGMNHDQERIGRINGAIRKVWPGKDSGFGALERVKKVGWNVAEAAYTNGSVCEASDGGSKSG